MNTAQVDRLQALLSRVQLNRQKPRASTAGPASRVAAVAQPVPRPAAAPEPSFEVPHVQDSIDTTPPPAAFAKPQPHQRPSAEPARRAAVEPERVRVPDMKPPAPAPRVAAQPERAMPAPARPTAPGATPLEMALEGEVARAAESAAAMPAPAPRPQPLPEPVAPPVEARRQAPPAPEPEIGGRVLADPTPPQPTRPIVQAVTKHPPTQPHTFTELLKRSLALRPR